MTNPPSHPSSIEQQIDAALDEIQQARAQLLARPASPHRSVQLAELAEAEAAWWARLCEHSDTRVHWRAALSAREHAQHTARRHRRQAGCPQPAPPATAGATA